MLFSCFSSSEITLSFLCARSVESSIMPIVSVIIPCYNSQDTIVRALESVAGQDYDVEAIVVDDQSTDESMAKLAEYAESIDLPLKMVRHERNQGVAVSRNDGLAQASGKYVVFLDADDALAPDFCQRMVQSAEQYGAECVCCNAVSMSGRASRTILPEVDIAISPEELYEQNNLTAFGDSCWGKLFSADLLRRNEISFVPELNFGEDSLFATTALLKTRKICLNGTYSGYFYFDTPGSLMKCVNVAQRLDNLECLLWRLRDVCAESGLKLTLLRKSMEYVWSIKKFGGKKRKEMLAELPKSRIFQEILFPVLSEFGKGKHRWLIRRLAKGKTSFMSFW